MRDWRAYLCAMVLGGFALNCGSPAGGAATDGGGIPDGAIGSCQGAFSVVQVEANAVDHSSLSTAYLFDPTLMHRFDVQVSEADLATLDRDPQAETYVPATVRFDGFEYRGAALRYKGGFNTLRACFDSAGMLDTSMCRKLSLKLSFNEYASCGRLSGVRKVVLNSMSQDPTLLHERVGSVFRQRAGVHTPRVSYATASINGVDRGVFALVEEVDQEYLKATYANASGDLYKSVWPRYPEIDRYKAALVTNRTKSDGSTMLALYEAVNTATEANFLERTAGLVSSDCVARRLAVGYIVGDNDGPATIYCYPDGNGVVCSNSNYFWYDEPGRGFDLISWDGDGDLEVAPVSLDPSLFAHAPTTCEPILICDYERTYFESEATCATDDPTMLPPACDPLIRLSVATNPSAYQRAIADVAAAYVDGTIIATVNAAVGQLETVIEAERAWGLDPATWRTTAGQFREQMMALGQKVRAAARR